MTFSSRTSAVAVISGLIEKALQFSEQVLHIWTEITLSNLHVFLVHIYTLNLHLNKLWCDCSVNVVHLNKCECCYMNLGAHLRNGLRLPEKVGLCPLPIKFWCGSTEIWTQPGLQTVYFFVIIGICLHYSLVQALEPPSTYSRFMCAKEELLVLFWLLYTFYKLLY